jgi:hypothetical protein
MMRRCPGRAEALYLNPNIRVLALQGGGAGAIGTRRGSGKGGASPAGNFQPDRRTALGNFRWKSAWTTSPIIVTDFESRRPIQQIDSGRICLDADGLEHDPKK